MDRSPGPVSRKQWIFLECKPKVAGMISMGTRKTLVTFGIDPDNIPDPGYGLILIIVLRIIAMPLLIACALPGVFLVLLFM